MTGSSPVLAAQQVELADRIDDLTRGILDSPPYVEEPGIVERLVEWVVSRFPETMGEGIGRVLALVLQGIIWVAVAAFLVAVAWLVVRRIGPDAFRRRPAGPGTTTTVGADGRSASEWLGDARAARDEGRHRDAVRAAYRAVVVHLVSLDAIPAMAGATVGAHRVALRDGDVVAELHARGFDEASDVFERAWYADGVVGAGDVDTVLAAASALGLGERVSP